MQPVEPLGEVTPFMVVVGKHVLQLVNDGATMGLEFWRCVRLYWTSSPSAPSTHFCRARTSGLWDRTLAPHTLDVLAAQLAHSRVVPVFTARVALKEDCPLGGSDNQHLFLPVPEAGSLRSGCLYGQLPGDILFLAVPSFTPTLWRQKEKNEPSRVLSYKGTNLITRTPPS